MGLMDSMGDSLKGMLGEHAGLVDKAMDFIHDQSHGGLEGMVEKLKASGLGETVNSWISTGKNLPISAEQLKHALGPDSINSLAQKFGIDASEVGEKLSGLLPSIVDKLTPDGKLPSGK